MKREVVEPLNEDMRNKFLRLQEWTRSLALAVENDVPQMEKILDVKGRLVENCPSRHAMAGLVLRHVEEKLREVTAAVADIKQDLSA